MTGITFAQQDKLPKLPIPDLELTCQRYLAALKPLQTENEFDATKAAVDKFLSTSGPLLQKRLIDYASSRSSYIEQFWYDSYLNHDSPVVLNLNPFFLLEDDTTPLATTQVQRAATVTTSSLRFVRALRREELPPDSFRNKTLCMYQYSRLFGSARIPSYENCVMQCDNSSRHIVVLCHSQFYWFDVLDDNNDLIMSEADMAVNFQTIINDAEQTPISEIAKFAIGVLTTENRRIWATIRETMETDSDMTNHECIKIIDSALFVVCLDHSSPTSLADLAQNMLCGSTVLKKGVQVGTCTNRWYDKLQIIITRNAKAGINFEHTGVDGHTVLRYVSDVYTDTILRFAKSINGQSPSLWASSSPDPSKRDPASFGDVTTTPHKLEWLLVPELALSLRFAETHLADLIQQNDFCTLEFSHYGMQEIKNMGFSPDAFVQMSFQAAYYVLYGHVECTYEPAMTKMFLHGRTEAVRSVTPESVLFVRKFCEDISPEEKLDYLRRACAKHTAITKECLNGQGQDRHLYALFRIWKNLIDSAEMSGEQKPAVDDELPAIFADEGWDTINHNVLSTSNCGNPSLRLFGFGPATPNGYGIGYIIKNDSITLCVSSKHRQTQRLVDTLQSYYLDVRSLWKQTKHNSMPAYSTNARGCSRERLAAPPSEPYGRSLLTPRRQQQEEVNSLLGGFGYFDISDYQTLRTRASSPERGSARGGNGVRREIGKKLRLAEY
ncbi:hypothetical protein DV495_000446 [Geotrichum candidum]|uniref:Similar to Saccharomyces cerevisiae YAR035W YAT1 Outer mitochondrial carnitine acetyltransferase n=1 Tax=Geotrichum candidum TaxID=1173061 RepID=A0A0J9XIC6_GEOCN|nr:hypothetical protein DV452_003929 [Geotrichum candidum]KAI9210820.1 hypothetical protein DS838_004296 [Geotrichum bryndzae]KAF5135864.1 hypothetical protein DV495_000446 [Geotrichum candidum]KAF7501940.1 hypothetical protein DV113_000074 [Geotrichum candidum]KAI8135876.1 hypothetical protein DUD61_000501 [Geotrichum candidum]